MCRSRSCRVKTIRCFDKIFLLSVRLFLRLLYFSCVVLYRNKLCPSCRENNFSFNSLLKDLDNLFDQCWHYFFPLRILTSALVLTLKFFYLLVTLIHVLCPMRDVKILVALLTQYYHIHLFRTYSGTRSTIKYCYTLFQLNYDVVLLIVLFYIKRIKSFVWLWYI